MTGEFPAQRASYTESVSIWWRHHEFLGAGENKKSDIYAIAAPLCGETTW